MVGMSHKEGKTQSLSLTIFGGRTHFGQQSLLLKKDRRQKERKRESAGKTTLVETLAGQLKPYIGDVLLNGTPIEHAQTEVVLVQSNDLHLPLLNVFETLKIAFYGSATELPNFLNDLCLPTPMGYNPADYMLELLNENTLNDRSPIQEKIVQEMYRRRQEPGWECKSFINKYPITCHHKHSSPPPSGHHAKKYDTTVHLHHDEVEVLVENSTLHPSVFSTSFGHQFNILLCRNFHNARRRILNPISLIQNFYILAVCVLIWWRPERIEREVMDRMGLSIGVFIGSALQPPWTVMIVSLGLLSMMLWGGAFNTPPSWLSWGKYASFFFYGLQALIALEFKDAPPIKCSPNSTLPVCNMVNPNTNRTVQEFDSDVILMVQKITWPVWQYVTVLLYDSYLQCGNR
uniref:Uncharacterized protein n=1 Tax=Magallana gigas TaxID=29159 RepID=K1PCG2_MAGGI